MERVRISAEELKTFDSVFRRNLMNTLTGPKPAWIMGTVNPAGLANFGLFSNVVHVGASPPSLGVLFRPLTVPRHSYENTFREGFAGFSLVDENNLEVAHQLSAPYDADGSELALDGLNWEQDEETGVPLLKDAAIRLILSPAEQHSVQLNDTVFVVFNILRIEVNQDLPGEDGMIDLTRANSVACLGLDAYMRVSPYKRYWYAKVGYPVREKPWMAEK
jgi:flavin reductase (DIM6/NTAB) family NADH-FMN oxidoreductase RutF